MFSRALGGLASFGVAFRTFLSIGFAFPLALALAFAFRLGPLGCPRGFPVFWLLGFICLAGC